MSEIKYLDKKKVVVVGKVNSTDTIVQEIYIVNGAEVPQGENFVVKTCKLLESPSETWEEREIKRLKNTFETEKEYWENSIKKQNSIFRRTSTVVSKKLEYLKKVDKNFDTNQFERFINYVTGRYKYLVKSNCGDFVIVGFNTAISSYDNNDNERGLHLISFFGRSDGYISEKVNCYYDGSGSYTDVYPFKKLSDAVNFVCEKINSKKLITKKDIELSVEYGFKISDESMLKYKENIKSNAENFVKRCKEQLEKAEQDLKNVSDL